MENLSDRVAQRLKELGLRPVDISKALGVGRGTVSSWTSGNNSPTGERLIQLSKLLQTTPEWLLTGKGVTTLGTEANAFASHRQQLPSGTQAFPVLAWDAPEDLAPETHVIVPRVDVRFSAGDGFEVNYEPDFKHDGMAFRMAWIRQRHLNPKNLIVVEVDGDSMSPSIKSGSMVTLDVSHNSMETVSSGRVYALRYGNELRIKRLSRRFDGALIIDSDNTMFKQEIVPPEQLEHITIIGRYVAHSYDGEV